LVGGRDLSILNTPEDAVAAPLSEQCLSMSYCEGADPLTPRFRGGRPVSAPLTMFDDQCPDSPRVLEVVEKSESVSWKLEYEGALSSLPPPLPSSSVSPGSVKRKMSPGSAVSPLVVRRCRSTGLMTQSLDLSLTRSQSCDHSSSAHHSPLSRTVSTHALPRSNSVRRKILPSFEPLSESTESDSDESKKNSPVTETRVEVVTPLDDLVDDARVEVVTPAPVDIGDVSDEEVCAEISSSSEIEIGVDPADITTDALHSHSDDTPDTDPEVTIRSGVVRSTEDSVTDLLASPDVEAADLDLTLASDTGH